MGHDPPEQVKTPAEDYKYINFLETFNAMALSGKIGVALFGTGRAGMIHLNNLKSNNRVNLLYIVEADDERSKKVKASTGLETTQFVNCSEMDKVLGDPKVQAVVIATPTQSHYPLVIESLKKGKAVFCEKPIANQIPEIKECYDVAKAKDLPLLCAFNRRFDPSFLNVFHRVQGGEIGSIHMIKSCSRDSPLPPIEYLKTSNGIFHDCSVHDIDLCCWIMGEYPSKVYASATAHMKHIEEIDDHDTVAIHFNFPSGGMACIDLSRFSVYGYDQRLEVFGPQGMLQCGNQNALGVQLFKPVGVSESPIWHSFASRYEEAYKKEMDHFLNVIEGKESLRILRDETLSVCKIVLACEESVRTGKAVNISYD